MNRTVCKSLTYGLMHLVVATAVAFALTGSWRAALAIGLIEPFVQTFAFALHERAWAGRDRRAAAAADALSACACVHVRLSGVKDLKLDRTAAKADTYAVMHLVVAMTVAFALTGSWTQALAIGLIEPVVQTLAFVLHERAWGRSERRRADRALA